MMGFIDSGKKEGANLVAGGNRCAGSPRHPHATVCFDPQWAPAQRIPARHHLLPLCLVHVAHGLLSDTMALITSDCVQPLFSSPTKPMHTHTHTFTHIHTVKQLQANRNPIDARLAPPRTGVLHTARMRWPGWREQSLQGSRWALRPFSAFIHRTARARARFSNGAFL